MGFQIRDRQQDRIRGVELTLTYFSDPAVSVVITGVAAVIAIAGRDILSLESNHTELCSARQHQRVLRKLPLGLRMGIDIPTSGALIPP